MKRIVHISDLHFGRTEGALVEALLAAIPASEPGVVVVSGDLTQRATEAQFKAAAAFLARIAFPCVVVPGNHDVPLWDVARRFLRPFERWRRHVSDELEPVFDDGELVVVGVNTARSLTWKEGRISHQQIAQVRDRLLRVRPGAFKAIVTHHPFIPPEASGARPVGRAERALAALEACGVDLLLAGHLHESSADESAVYRTADRGLIVVQAGTTLSVRRRGEANSFNTIDVSADRVVVTVHRWSDAQRAFAPALTKGYIRQGAAWRRERGEAG